MEKNQWVMDVEQSSFDRDVLEKSSETPVLVDFWAPWCGPCRTLGPILEKLAVEMQGRFILAKIDSDKNPEISRQYDVKGIPSVKLFVDGEVEDEFSGALPERSVRQFLERAIPSPMDKLAQQAGILADQENWDKAAELYTDILTQEPNHVLGLLGMIRVLLHLGSFVEAHQLFARLPLKTAESPEGKVLRARLTFSGTSDNLAELENTIANTPSDLVARLALGRGLIQKERYAAGMEQFLEVFRQDRAFQDAAGRKALLKVFDLLGSTHPLVTEYRSKLSWLLFS